MKKNTYIFSLLILGGFAAMYLTSKTSHWYIQTIYFALCGLFVLYRNSKYQKEENKIAKKIVEDILSHNISPEKKYALYLRSFSIDQQMRRRSYSIISLFFGNGWLAEDRNSGQSISFETKLVNSFKNELGLELITVSDPTIPEKFVLNQSIGEFVLDAKWKDDIKKLIEHAEIIIKIPGLTQGSEFEFNFIFGNKKLIKKTIFIIPPQEDDFKNQLICKNALSKINLKWREYGLPNIKALESGGRVIRFINKTAICNLSRKNNMTDLIWQIVASVNEAKGKLGLANINEILCAPEFIGENVEISFDTKGLESDNYYDNWKVSNHFKLEGNIHRFLDRLFPNKTNLLMTIYLSKFNSNANEDNVTVKVTKDMSIENINALGFLGYCIPATKATLLEEYNHSGRLLLLTFATYSLSFLDLRIELENEYKQSLLEKK